MLDSTRYGEYFADGSVRMPEASALSGKPVAQGDPIVTLSKHHFVMVKAIEKQGLARVDWEAMKETWRSQFEGVKAAQASDVVVSTLPDFETMTIAEAKKYADDHKINVEGKRGQKQIAAAIRAHYVMQQFANPAPIATDPLAAVSPVAPTSSAAEGSA